MNGLIKKLSNNKMQINVHYDRKKEEKSIELDDNSSIKDLLAKMSINPVTVIVSKENNIILEDENLKDNDKIRIISVISGG